MLFYLVIKGKKYIIKSVNAVGRGPQYTCKMVKTNKRDLKSPKRVGGGTGATNSVTLKKAAAATATTTTRSQTTALAANIKVVVRVRPPNSKEQNDNQR